jgi:predicted nucleic acid-binding protein
LSEANLVRQPVTTLAQAALLPIDARAHDDPATSPLLEAAFAGAVISGQTVYDWTYLALAVGLDCQMVTADEKFFQALRGGAIAKYLGWVADF